MEYCNAPGEPGRPPRTTRQAPRRTSAARHLTALHREERGQSLVLIVMSMTLIVLIAAVAIDVSQWFVKHHQAQVTADAAALAAANYMGGGGASGTATTWATTYAADNGLPITGSNVVVDTTAETVAVTVPTTGPLSFAGISLGSGPSITARAVASWVTRDCTSSGTGCSFMYAGDDVCSGTTGVTDASGNAVSHGITINKKGTGSVPAIVGDVISASNITSGISGNPKFISLAVRPATDVNGATCSGPTKQTPKPFTSALVEAVRSDYPIKYNLTYAACTTTCDVNQFPSYCTTSLDSTAASETVSTISTNAIYCDAGTGNPTDPSTWNGAITVNSGGNATFIGGTVTYNLPSNASLGPAAGNKLLAYASDCNKTTPALPAPCPASGTTTTGADVTINTNGNSTIGGDVFAPAGVIDAELGGTPTLTGFLESWDIIYNANGTVSGQGPPVDSQGNFVSDYLVQ